jgi:hypothetical protein
MKRSPSDENERSVASTGSAVSEPAAWAVLDSRGTVCVAYTCREAAEAYCEGTFNRLAPLYRQPQPCPYVTGKTTRYCTLTPFTLTDAERDALLGAAEACDSRERRSIEFRLPQEAEHWRCLASTIRGLSERLSGVPETSIREECHK